MQFRGRVILVAAIVLALAASLPAASAGKVVVQRGIAGVHLQMTPDQVRDVLGSPRGVKNGRNPVGRYFEYHYSGLLIRFQGLKYVTLISTNRKSERTGNGIGVGSTKAQVRAKFTGARCRTGLGARLCYVGVLKPGLRATIFYLNDRNRVNRVAVGLVSD